VFGWDELRPLLEDEQIDLRLVSLGPTCRAEFHVNAVRGGEKVYSVTITLGRGHVEVRCDCNRG
jgi:hypothetical protein